MRNLIDFFEETELDQESLANAKYARERQVRITISNAAREIGWELSARGQRESRGVIYDEDDNRSASIYVDDRTIVLSDIERLRHLGTDWSVSSNSHYDVQSTGLEISFTVSRALDPNVTAIKPRR